MKRHLAAATLSAVVFLLSALPASATPVCTDGYKGGPPLAACGGRVFPEAQHSRDYVQLLADPTGFIEYRHGIEYLARTYPRWVSFTTLHDLYNEPDAVSAGFDGKRSTDPTDTGDGHDILVVKVTDHQAPDAGKQTMLFSLSVHGDEKGGIEGGVRTVEDLAIAATNGGKIGDGLPGYPSTTGTTPQFHSYEVKDVLAKEAVYFIDFNADGWAVGDHTAPTPGMYTRGNRIGTDLNRQMPTVGRIDSSRNPLEEPEMFYGHKFMREVAAKGVNGLMAYGADVHGEGQSRAWVDIMYPAGQFDSIKHRQLMAIAERTKSVIDDTLFLGTVDQIESLTGGDTGEGIEDSGAPKNTIPTKPARWGTVWDTLGYTDTGFIGDYLAEELGVTGMDYEIALNHSDTGRPYGRPWGVLLQENYINATRAIVKTAMAYALYQEEEFANFRLDPKGRVGYVYNPEVVTDTDANGAGKLPGPSGNGIGRNGKPVEQKSYSATNMGFFEDEAGYVEGGLNKVAAADIAASSAALDGLDSLVLADVVAPADSQGRTYDRAAYLANIKAWVQRGGNLVLTDRALHAMGDMGVVPAADIKDWVQRGGNLVLTDRALHAMGDLGVLPAAAIKDVKVYQPYSNIRAKDHAMVSGLRGNARQLAEATLVGYGIGSSASPMTVVTSSAWTAAGGTTVGTTGNAGGSSDDLAQTSVGELPVGKGKIRILGGGLPMPTETQDHRYGLKDYALSYSGLYILENSIKHDAPGLGAGTAAAATAASGSSPLAWIVFLPLVTVGLRRRLRRLQ